MQIVSSGDNLHEMSNKRQKDCLWKQRSHYGLEILFSGKNKKYVINLSYVEIAHREEKVKKVKDLFFNFYDTFTLW